MNTIITKIILFIFLLLAPFSSYAAPRRFTVVIDAGHGGHDPGAVGKRAKEKTINLGTALELGRLIERNCPDVKVVYTRKTDVFIPLNTRAEIANNNKADLFISIHTNALPKGRIVRGAETYTLGMARANENLEVAKKENSVILLEKGYNETYKGFNPNSSESYIIFEFMQDKNMTQSVSFARKIQQQFRGTAQRIDKGVHQAGFLVLRETAMPSVLVELGYISTPDEENFLSSANGQAIMAKSIYNAFVSYKNGTRTSGQAVEAGVAVSEAAAPATEKAQTTQQKVQTLPVTASDMQSQAGKQVKTARSEADVILANINPEPEKKEAGRAVQDTPLEQVAAVETVAAENTSASKSSNASSAQAEAGGKPVFAIQIMTSDRVIPATDRRFKGLKGVDHFKENGIIKYTYGSSTNYNEVYALRKRIAADFNGCFIIAFLNGKKIDVNEGIRIFKSNRR